MIKLVEIRPPKIAFGLLGISCFFHWIFLAEQKIYFINLYLAIILNILGLAIMLWAWKLFQNYQNPICPTSQPEVLISEGVYRFSRNPMYFGITIALTGVFFFFGSIPFLFPPIIFFLLMNFIYVPFEENSLRFNFRKEFDKYQKKVRRWI